MTALVWNKTDKPYYSGVDHGVLYLPGVPGVAWNGLSEVTESNNTAGGDPVYFEGVKIGETRIYEDFSLNVTSYMYPPSFDSYIDDVKTNRTFGFSYRTGDQIHLVYNATLVVPSRSFQTMRKEINSTMFEWVFLTKPISYTGIRPTSKLVLDRKIVPEAVWNTLTEILYGSSTKEPTLPNIETVMSAYQGASAFQIIDNGDGTWTAIGDESKIQFVDADTITLTAPTVVLVSENTYSMSSSS